MPLFFCPIFQPKARDFDEIAQISRQQSCLKRQGDRRDFQVHSSKPHLGGAQALEFNRRMLVELQNDAVAIMFQLPVQLAINGDLIQRRFLVFDFLQPSPTLLFIAYDGGSIFSRLECQQLVAQPHRGRAASILEHTQMIRIKNPHRKIGRASCRERV